MSKNLNDIPNEFLENFGNINNKSANNNNNNNKDFDVYISSNSTSSNNVTSNKLSNNKDFIWIFVMMLILFDII